MDFDVTHLESSDLQSNQVGLLISLLIRFPQIGSVRYNPESDVLKIVFIVNNISSERLAEFSSAYAEHLAAFHFLSRRQMSHFDLTVSEEGKLSLISIARDLETISRAEMVLTVSLVTQFFGADLVVEGPEVSEEDMGIQDDFLDSLFSAKADGMTEALIGFREKDRVFVFSQSNNQSI